MRIEEEENLESQLTGKSQKGAYEYFTQEFDLMGGRGGASGTLHDIVDEISSSIEDN